MSCCQETKLDNLTSIHFALIHADSAIKNERIFGVVQPGLAVTISIIGNLMIILHR